MCVFLRVLKFDFLEAVFKMNLIDGFVASLLIQSPFEGTNMFLKCLVFAKNYPKSHNGSVRFTLPSKATSNMRYQYFQQVGYMVYYLINMLTQTVYNYASSEPFSSEN